MTGKKKDVFSLLSELAGKKCNVTMTLRHKEKGSLMENQSLDGFLVNKETLLKEWEIQKVIVVLPQETEDVNAAETVLDDSSTN